MSTADRIDLRKELNRALQDLTWNVKGILLNDGKVMAVPPESRVVTAILHVVAMDIVRTYGRSIGLAVEDFPYETRGYPDMALSDGPLGKKVIALDIKTARYLGDDKVSRMTLGTYDGYFLHPKEKRLHGGTKCYHDYDEHWVAGIIYEWHPDKGTDEMVRVKECIVGQKWQVASKTSGSGDTANIGGIDSLEALRSLQNVFTNEEEFEEYWRDYAIRHPRKRTRLPQRDD